MRSQCGYRTIVAADIARAFASGDYPKRMSNLFFLGQRERKEPTLQADTLTRFARRFSARR